MAPVVELVGIGKTFPGVVALNGVDLALHPGRIHALVGENGAGKSTLLNILAGLLQPDRGEIRREGKPVVFRDARAAWAAGIVTVHQEVDLFPDLTVSENIAWQHGLAETRWGIDWAAEGRRCAAALEEVGAPVAPTAVGSALTPAQRQLVEIAGAISRSASVLILDEPTSSLSAAETERLFAHLRRFREQGTAIVYVSHRFEEIFALADEITVLRDGQRVWTGARAETSPNELIRHMVGREVVTTRASHRREPGAVAFACRGLTAADGSFADITLEVRRGEILGLYGLVGAGRSEWAQAVFGLRGVERGEVLLDGRPIVPRDSGQMADCGVAYVPEDRLRQGLCRGLGIDLNGVLATLRRLAPWGWLARRVEREAAEQITRQLAVRHYSLEQPIGTLSGGNQQKVVVGRWLLRDPSVLILDEPTRGVDVGAREEIYALVQRLADEGRAVVLISSDLPEVMSQSDRIGVFRGGRLAEIVDGEGASAEAIASLAFPTGESVRSGEQSTGRGGWRLPAEIGLAVFVACFFGVLHLITGRFLAADSVAGLLTEGSLLFVCAAGAMLVLLAGGLDISLGAIMALSAGVAGQLWEQGYSLAVVVPVAVGVGAAAGFINAGLSILGQVHPIVVTLGTMSVYRGLTLRWLGQDVQIPSAQRGWALQSWLGVPVLAWCGVVLAVGLVVWLRWTVAGRQLYALGSNARAARRVGIPAGRVWLRAFTLQGALVGLAGLLFLARTGSLQPTSYEDVTLQAIAAAVVGGVAITGGRGSVLGVLVGSVLLVALEPACIYLGLSPHWRLSLVGAVLLVAVLFDTLLRRRDA